MKTPDIKNSLGFVVLPDRCRGVAVVEFAVLSPLLLLLMLGLLDVGQLANVSHTVGNASRAGAAEASRSSTNHVSAVETVVSNYLQNSFPNLPAATVDAATQIKVMNSSGTLITGDLSSLSASEAVSVEVEFQYQSVRWLPLNTHWSTASPKVSTIMRRE